MSDAIPVNRIKGVGEKTAALFGKINVYTVDDLISHYPRDYETYDAPVSIREVSAGSVQAIYGQITAIPNVKKVRNLSILNAVLTDDNGTATLYSGTQNGSVRLRQKVEYAGNAKVQFICDGKLISERNL